MIKVFTLNKNGKIELTKIELEQLLNESYWEGYMNRNYWTYASPSITTPYYPITTDTKNPYTITGKSNINTDTNSITIKTTSDIGNIIK